MARPPSGGDTDQIKAVAAGECGVAVTNNYYWVRLLRSKDPKNKEVVSKVGFIWPNQSASGTHVNISGGGVAKNAPTQSECDCVPRIPVRVRPPRRYFANGNNECPVAKGATAEQSRSLTSLGNFKQETDQRYRRSARTRSPPSAFSIASVTSRRRGPRQCNLPTAGIDRSAVSMSSRRLRPSRRRLAQSSGTPNSCWALRTRSAFDTRSSCIGCAARSWVN